MFPVLKRLTKDTLTVVQSIRYSSTIRRKNVEIPVPWGIISGQFWGDENKKPILSIHGWKDNSATFDRVIPLLLQDQRISDKFSFLAIDLPGHGWSSHFPPGMIYQMVDILVLITRILKHFKWETVTLLGHSFGAITSFLYTGTHPDVVERFIALDALTPMIFNRSDMIRMVPQLIQDSLGFENKLKTRVTPTYAYKVALEKVKHGNVGGLDELGCKVLMSRGMVEEPAGSGLFKFTHDIRVHYLPVMTLSTKQVAYVAQNFACDVLHIKFDPGVNYERKSVSSKIEGWLNSEKNIPKDIRFKRAAGGHHVHLINPELINNLIADFLHESNLKSQIKT